MSGKADLPGTVTIGTYKSAKNHCNFAYSALACFRMGMSASASFHAPAQHGMQRRTLAAIDQFTR